MMEKDAAVPAAQGQAHAQDHEQWQGAVSAALPSTPASAAWPHIASFCALHRYLPGIDVCELAAGEDGRPGCVRYVASLAAATGEVGSWAREELLEVDDGARRLAYAVVGGNMGFGRYVATMSVVVGGGDGEEGEGEEEKGCRLVWAFECEPVPGWSRDGLLGYLDAGVKAIAARIEEAHAAAAANGAGDNGSSSLLDNSSSGPGAISTVAT